MPEIEDMTPDKTFVKDILDKVPYAELIKEYAECECGIKQTFTEVEDLVDGESAAVHWASTKDVDEVGDVMVPSGGDLDVFRKTGSVFIDHGSFLDGYSVDKVIGSNMWVKNHNNQGILAKTRFANTQTGKDAHSLVFDGHVKGWSIGFIGIKSSRPGDKDWGEAVNAAKAGGTKGYKPKWLDKAERIYTDWKLLEYSLVAIPCNREALTLSVCKDLGIHPDTIKMLGVDAEEVGEEIEELVQEEKEEEVVRLVKRIVPRTVKRVSAPLTDEDIARSVKRAFDIHRGRL